MKDKYFGYKVLGAMGLLILLMHASAKEPFNPFYTFYEPAPEPDSSDNDTSRQLIFPLQDDKGNPFEDEEYKAMQLQRPSNIEKSIEYDPEDNVYYLSEKVGNDFIRNPSYLTFDEYRKYRSDEAERGYWKRRLDALTLFNKKPVLPTMYKEGMFDRIFGGTAISVRPQGNVDITLGGNWQNIENPSLTQDQRKFGIFDFDMQMNINLVASIGEKLKLNISQNTKSTFDNQNLQKLEYTGKEDEIIKKIEAGNVSFPLNSSLVSGVQSLFGLKTQLQFGKLWVTSAVSQQKSQRKSMTIQGGGQTQQFSIKADDYEADRHFLLGQYFVNNYNKALENYPIIQSLVNINKIEVWVTNRQGVIDNVRDVVVFQDLGEHQPYNQSLVGASQSSFPDNRSNRLYDQLQQNPSTRSRTANSALQAMGLNEPTDFQRTTARKLNPSEFTYNAQLGYISLQQQPNPEDIVGVAYQYTVNGQTYQVGEFAESLPPDSTDQKVLFLKLLKGTSPRPTQPVWKLMMKNVYALGGFGLSKDDFRLNILYQDPGGGEKRYFPEGPKAGTPLLTLMNLDRLNYQGDPSPDGIFDYVEGVTINSQLGKFIFPVLEPFGNDLKPSLGGNAQLERKFLYQILYDSTKTIARQFQQNNRLVIKGSYKSSSSSEIFLGGFNIPQGSVSVLAGGQKLVEGTDFQIDYGLGRIKILNQGIAQSGIPINIQYEDNATFGFQQQNFLGTRLDYYFNDKFTLGGTYMRLKEVPFSNKMNFGDDPIKNTVLALDANYQSESQLITRVLDSLPIYSTSAPSFVTASGEVAGLLPGHSKQIDGLDPGGTIYIDDFEGTRSSYDLKFPPNAWTLASTPVNAKNKQGQILFPEATNSDSVLAGYNRAKLAWYFLDPTVVAPNTSIPDFVKDDPNQHYIRPIQQQDIFPQRSSNNFQNALTTFDLGYYPKERGPYNFDATNISGNGELLNPETRWGGIMRPIDNSDFEQANVEFIEFWLLDPFINNPTAKGGSLYINLGNVSEDVMKDGAKFFENGIPSPFDQSKVIVTPWGNVPLFQQQITRAFDVDPTARLRQDVGYDGMTDEEERAKFQYYLDQLATKVGAGSPFYQQVEADVSGDNYKYYRDAEYASTNLSILQRYKKFNNPHGNSPVTEDNSAFSSAATTIPESEDINRDNTLNQSEEYYQYRVDLTPSDLEVGKNFIVSKQSPTVRLLNGATETETWYQFKIPIREYQEAVGGIGDFRSIRFVRLFLNGFQDSVYLRFAKLELGRNQWRRYLFSLKDPGENIPQSELESTTFNLTSVSLEENSDRLPIPYVIPPGIIRQQQVVSNNQNVQLNEQAISMQVCGLKDGDSRAIFKEVGIDMRQFEQLRMFIHAESVIDQMPVNDGDLRGFVRIGSDFTNNYYEYQIPLKVTPFGSGDPNIISPEANRLELTLDDLVSIKTERNNAGQPNYIPYYSTDDKGNTIVIVGNPNLGDAKTVMLGVYNPKRTTQTPNDDGLEKCSEIWFNELRASGINEQGGYAAAAKVNLQLADLGSVRLGGNMHTTGYGNIDQKVNQRFRDDYYQYDGSTNLNMGKLLPKNWGVQLPVFMGYSQAVSNPEYDPYDLDVKLKDKLKNTNNKKLRDSIRKAAQDFTSITSFNVSNVRITGDPAKARPFTMPWSVKNFDLSYAYTKQHKRNPFLEQDDLTNQKLGLGYTYPIKTKPFEPFKKIVKSKSKWWGLIRDFNINYLPSTIAFRTELNKILNETQVRNISDGPYKIEPTYFKNFTWLRTYSMRWDLTRAMSFEYSATNLSRVDEPHGKLDSEAKRDTLWNNVKSLGRNTNYTHNLNASYTLPTQKIPLLDWTNVRLQYGNTYTWTASSLLARSQGNTIANTQNKTVNGEFNFVQLYNKNRWLRAFNTPKPRKPIPKKSAVKKTNLKEGRGENEVSVEEVSAPSEPEEPPAKPPKLTRREKKEKIRQEKAIQDSILLQQLAGLTDSQIDSFKKSMDSIQLAKAKLLKEKLKRERKAARKLRRATTPEISDGLRIAGRLLLSLRRITFNYNETGGTVLPGYMDSTQVLGMNTSTWYPGADFVFGRQPEYQWFNQIAGSGKLTSDSIFNSQLQQVYTQKLNIAGTLEPLQDLRIDLSLTKSFSKNYSELFKDVEGNGDYQHLNPYSTGSFNISYYGMKTLFKSSGLESEIFKQFLSNRAVVSNRLGNINPYTNGERDPNDPTYAKGYTQYSQDVLIPSFIAAYTDVPASEVPLLNYDNSSVKSNPFKYFRPFPNWRANYNGLSKIPFFRNFLQNLVISHAYSSTLSLNSFTTALQYQDLFGIGAPSFIDSNSGNYVPFYLVPNITLSDQLSPLIGIDASFRNSLTARFEYRTNRTVSMSLIDYQIAETKGSEFIIGLGYRQKGLTLPFEIFGLRRLENDINFKVDVGIRDDKSSSLYFAQKVEQATRGQRVITISPTIDYIINDRLTLRIYYDRRRTIPYTTQSYPITVTRGGITLRFIFANN